MFKKSDLILLIFTCEDFELNFEFISDSIELLGYEVAEFYSQQIDIDSLIHPDDLKLIKEQFGQAIERKLANFSLQFRVFTKLKDVKWVKQLFIMNYPSEGMGYKVESFAYVMPEPASQRSIPNMFPDFTQNHFDLLNEAVGINDENFNFVYVNDAFCRLVGYSQEEILHTPTLDYISTDFRSKVDFELHRRAKTGENIRYESEIVSKSGQVIPVLVSPRSIFDPNGQYRGSISIVFEISHQKLFEQEISHLRQRYQTFFEATSYSLLISEEGEIQECNHNAYDLFGLRAHGIIGKALWDLTDPNFLARDQAKKQLEGYIHRALSGDSQAFQWVFQNKSGKILKKTVQFSKIILENRRFLYVLINDLSKVQFLEYTLKKEQDILQTTLDGIQEGVISLDLSGNIVLFNSMAEKLTGWEKSEVFEKPLSQFCKFFDYQYPQIPFDLFKDISDRVASPYGINIEKRVQLVTKFSQLRKISYQSYPIYDLNAITQGFVIVFRDMTSHEKLQEELFQAEKMESIGLLAGGIAHDFNNILTSILGNISIAKIDLTDDQAELKTLLEESEKAILRANKLTKQLLTFSKGGAPIKDLTSLKEIIQENANFAMHGSRSKLYIKLADDLWNVEVDEGQISQCIQNIVINGNQAMPDGGNIIINAHNVKRDDFPPFLNPNRDYVVISFMDQGMGIPEDIQPHIFDPYFTTKKDGTGLGLSIVYSIITKHDGFITLDSKLGEGTIFYLYLPAERKPIERHESKVSTLNTGKGRILIMDDEADIQIILSKMLEKLGYTPEVTREGREMLAFYRDQFAKGISYDYVILDLTIPGGMGGREAAAKILEIDPNQVLIVTSGYSNDPVMSNFQNYGFKARLVKPFTIYDLNSIFDTLGK